MVFHVKSTFPLESFDWLVLAKNVIVNSGRETAGDIFTQTFTFRQNWNNNFLKKFLVGNCVDNSFCLCRPKITFSRCFVLEPRELPKQLYRRRPVPLCTFINLRKAYRT